MNTCVCQTNSVSPDTRDTSTRAGTRGLYHMATPCWPPAAPHGPSTVPGCLSLPVCQSSRHLRCCPHPGNKESTLRREIHSNDTPFVPRPLKNQLKFVCLMDEKFWRSPEGSRPWHQINWLPFQLCDLGLGVQTLAGPGSPSPQWGKDGIFLHRRNKSVKHFPGKHSRSVSVVLTLWRAGFSLLFI